MKGFSIFTIVIYHLINTFIRDLPGWILQAAEFGGTGVHVFFFCSGFGLYMSFLHKETNYLEFVKKRFFKVYIPYIIAVILYCIIPIVPYKGNRFEALLSHLLLYKMFIPKYETSFGEFFWFISTLIQFYLIFIPLCKFKKKLGNRIFALFGLGISTIWWIAMAITGLHFERILGSCFLQFLWEFCLGMIIADKMYCCKEVNISNHWLLITTIVGIGSFGFLGIKGGWAASINDIPALFGYGFFALLLYQVKSVQKTGIWFGKISYEWYLLHVLTLRVAFSFLQGWIAAAVGLLLSVAIAYLYHIIIQIIQKKLSV